MSTAYHPQTNGQMEPINQLMNSYLQSYFNYQQNDRASMLAIAESVYKNSKHVSTKICPVYGNYGFELQTTWSMDIQYKNRAPEL